MSDYTLSFKVDHSRAFTDSEMKEVEKLPYLARMRAMARPNADETMSKEEQYNHYVKSKWPSVPPDIAKDEDVGWAQASKYRDAQGNPVLSKEDYLAIPRENRG